MKFHTIKSIWVSFCSQECLRPISKLLEYNVIVIQPLSKQKFPLCCLLVEECVQLACKTRDLQPSIHVTPVKNLDTPFYIRIVSFDFFAGYVAIRQPLSVSALFDRGQMDVDFAQLSLEDATNIRHQLSNEVDALTRNMMTLQQTAGRLAAAGQTVEHLMEQGEGTNVLLPLTESLYVPGKLKSVEKVTLEIGTGYYVEVGSQCSSQDLDETS